MTYRELKVRVILLNKYGFERQHLSKTYRRIIHQGKFQHSRYLPYIDIKQIRDFRGFLLYHIEDMENELREYVRNHDNN